MPNDEQAGGSYDGDDWDDGDVELDEADGEGGAGGPAHLGPQRTDEQGGEAAAGGQAAVAALPASQADEQRALELHAQMQAMSGATFGSPEAIGMAAASFHLRVKAIVGEAQAKGVEFDAHYLLSCTPEAVEKWAADHGLAQ